MINHTQNLCNLTVQDATLQLFHMHQYKTTIALLKRQKQQVNKILSLKQSLIQKYSSEKKYQF